MNRKKIDVYDNLTGIVKELKEGVLLTAKADDQGASIDPGVQSGLQAGAGSGSDQ